MIQQISVSLKTVKVLEVATDEKSESLKPYQAYIAQKTYPLYRETYIISKEAYTGLGTGFTAFVASERGQRVVLEVWACTGNDASEISRNY
ncbi:MAG: substrate-binding domain-containing protein [Ignavibacteriales bacterium]|nr:substrate-binding domain-containing protein [Ignavibacteriales bacterium]